MNKQLKPTELEEAVMNMLLEGDEPVKKTLLNQWRNSRITKREHSGVGFFTYFNVLDTIPRVTEQRKNFTSDDLDDIEVIARVPELSNGIGFALFISDGQIDMLEGYTFGEKWPKKVSAFRLEKIKSVK